MKGKRAIIYFAVLVSPLLLSPSAVACSNTQPYYFCVQGTCNWVDTLTVQAAIYGSNPSTDTATNAGGPLKSVQTYCEADGNFTTQLGGMKSWLVYVNGLPDTDSFSSGQVGTWDRTVTTHNSCDNNNNLAAVEATVSGGCLYAPTRLAPSTQTSPKAGSVQTLIPSNYLVSAISLIGLVALVSVRPRNHGD